MSLNDFVAEARSTWDIDLEFQLFLALVLIKHLVI